MSEVKKKEFFAVYSPSGELCARVEGTIKPDGTFSHLVSRGTAWARTGREYTGCFDGISAKTLIELGYKGIVEIEGEA